MITMIVHSRVPSSNSAAYEELLMQVTETTRHKEPGVLYYGWAKSADDPETYVVIEVYADEHAHKVHMTSTHVRDALPKVMALIDGAPQIRQYVSAGQVPVSLQLKG